jgi:dethiobiotin synthetase
MNRLAVAVIGTDTGVGKTWVAGRLVQGLRAMGRRVWVHKPVACGGWLDDGAEDGRFWKSMADQDQLMATVCPHQYPEACSPHLAAQAAGQQLHLADLILGLERARPRNGADFVVEGAGGLLTPLTSGRETLADLLMMVQLPLVVVTRPHLGTLNHTALTVEVARGRGLEVLGLVIDDHQLVPDTLAIRTAAEELTALTATPVLARLSHGDTSPATARQLAQAVLEAGG